MSIKIFVVIPIYRLPALLSKCLEALIIQQLQHDAFEIIMLSDGPVALTENILKQYLISKHPQIKYFTLRIKKGPAALRNYGWNQSTAELVAFTDDDCVPGKTWLKSFYDTFKTNADAVFTGKTVVPLPTDPKIMTLTLQTFKM